MQKLQLSLLELRDPRLRRLRGTIEILGPAREPLFHLRLNLVQLVAQSCRRIVLPLRNERPPLLGDLPLLLLEQRARVGPGAGEGELQLCGTFALLALDECKEFGLRLG